MKTKMAEFRKDHEELLEKRRQRLVELLTTEEKQYEQEFFANLETPEQVREKMAKRLHELRSKREEMRKAEVDQRLEKRFKKSADELRMLDSKFVAASTKLDQEQQMIEKVKRRDDQMQEELLYAKLWEADAAQKERREIEEAEARKKQVAERMKMLNWQKETRDAERVAQARREREEKSMLKTQWKQEDLRAKALDEEKRKQMRDLNQELIEHNALENGLKGKIVTIEKEKDKAMISQIVEESRKLAELEQEMKLKRLAEAKETLRTIDNRAELQRQEEQMIERLAEEERKKQMALEDERFMREQNARITLLKDVYSDRAKAVETKRKL